VSEYSPRWWRGAKVNLCGRSDAARDAAVLKARRSFLAGLRAECTWPPALDRCVMSFSAHGLPGVWYRPGGNTRLCIISRSALLRS